MEYQAPDRIVLFYEDPTEPVEVATVVPGDATFKQLVSAFRAFAKRVGYSESTIDEVLGVDYQ
jgi:hypothetical protein